MISSSGDAATPSDTRHSLPGTASGTASGAESGTGSGAAQKSEVLGTEALRCLLSRPVGSPSGSSAGMPSGSSEAGDAVEDLPLEASIMCHIFVLNSVLERMGNRLAEAHNLTLPQWMALGCIVRERGEGLTHSELGQRLMLSKAPITGVVDRLERMELVTRTTSESDRRVSRIRGTVSGSAVWHQVRDALRAQSQRHCDGLGEEGRQQMLSLLSMLLQQVAASDPMLAAMSPSGTRKQPSAGRRASAGPGQQATQKPISRRRSKAAAVPD